MTALVIPHPTVTAAHARRLAEARERLAAVIAAGDRASIRRVREIVERLEREAAVAAWRPE